MSGIVLALGKASNHVPLIKKEMEPYFGDVKILKLMNVHSFNENRIHKLCVKRSTKVIAYVLPPDGQSLLDGQDYETTRDYWKHLAEEIYPSRSVKELEVVAYAHGRRQYWLDGIEQFQGSSREPAFAFDMAACY